MQRLRHPLALTMGEPSGISGEIVVKAWKLDVGGHLPPFVYLGDPAWLREEVRQLRLDAHVIEVNSPEEGLQRFQEGIPVLPIGLNEKPKRGKPAVSNAGAVIESIRRGCELTSGGAFSALVTSPIQKSVLYSANFRFPGHTEYLAELTGASRVIMMLSVEGLRVVPVTIHLPLAQAIATLNTDTIVETSALLVRSLKQDLGVSSPRIAVAALNPHAGEDGALGREEVDIIRPAIVRLQAMGLNIAGPLPADTLFHPQARAQFDAVVCMYHDQALIPLKTIDFQHGVNSTLGLPIVRTSPDHGTALDIAGQGIADPSSLVAALRLAAHMASKRAGNSS
jgi:4-hydroxythreonine-4-phosphate dehydrogenase